MIHFITANWSWNRASSFQISNSLRWLSCHTLRNPAIINPKKGSKNEMIIRKTTNLRARKRNNAGRTKSRRDSFQLIFHLQSELNFEEALRRYLLVTSIIHFFSRLYSWCNTMWNRKNSCQFMRESHSLFLWLLFSFQSTWRGAPGDFSILPTHYEYFFCSRLLVELTQRGQKFTIFKFIEEEEKK